MLEALADRGKAGRHEAVARVVQSSVPDLRRLDSDQLQEALCRRLHAVKQPLWYGERPEHSGSSFSNHAACYLVGGLWLDQT